MDASVNSQDIACVTKSSLKEVGVEPVTQLDNNDKAHANKFSKLEHLIVDSGALIKQPSLQDFGKNIYSVAEVVGEIRDEATRKRLSVLPYKIDFRQPDSTSLKAVAEFARKSGDFATLSVTDLKLLALTLMLTKDIEGGARLLRTEPVDATTVRGSPFIQTNGVAVQLAGFHRPTAKAVDHNNDNVSFNNEKTAEDAQELKLTDLDDAVENGDIKHSHAIDPSTASDELSNDADDDSESDNSSENEDDDDADWITPDNLHEAIEKMNLTVSGDDDAAATQTPRVACMTTDYAMQNVLLHMGLSVVSVDGMIIRRLRQWTLRCYGCFHITNDFSRKFCPKCGNMTLKRVSYTIDQQGERIYHISKRRTLNLRGTKYSLPTPHGGKHPNFPVLREDQRQAQNKPSKKALQKIDPLSENYIVRESPFAENDLTSRAARLGNRPKHAGAGGGRPGNDPTTRRKNPNEARRKRK